MRSVRLARIATEAEGLRLRALAGRIVVRALLGLIALLFVLGALVFAHIAAWYWLLAGLHQTPLAAACKLGGVDLLAAVVLGFLATRSRPSRSEIEALDLRRKAVEAIGDTPNLIRLAIQVVRVIANRQQRKPD